VTADGSFATEEKLEKLNIPISGTFHIVLY